MQNLTPGTTFTYDWAGRLQSVAYPLNSGAFDTVTYSNYDGIGNVGQRTDGNGVVSWFGNPKAWTQPCELGPGLVPIPDSPSGCVPLTGAAALGGGGTQIPGPGFHRLDFSTFKEIPLSERFRLQFRAEIFNIFNHPNFTAPGFGGNGVVSISGSTNYTSANFGEIGSTRDDPNDAREIQFALKLYY